MLFRSAHDRRQILSLFEHIVARVTSIFSFACVRAIMSERDMDVVPGQTSMLARTIRKHFTIDKVRSVLIPLLEQRGTVSLRTLEYFVVNYAKKKTLFRVVSATRSSTCTTRTKLH